MRDIRKRFYFQAVYASILVLITLSVTAEAQQSVFSRTLQVGAVGEDVRYLQQILNTDTVTMVAEAGPGSPGQETTYFGPLTAQAVVRFQEKHAAEVLVPAGLGAGTGIFGPYTRAALTALGTPKPTPVSVAATPVDRTDANPNLENLDQFISTVDAVGKEQGYSVDTLAKVKGQIIRDAATTTDLRATFLKMVEEKGDIQRSAQEDSSARVSFSYIKDTFKEAFGVKKADAQASTPFGGRLLYSYFCTCSFTWLLTLSPLPPSYATLLTYTPFSQAYLSYNIPYTQNLLGKYSSGGQCLVYVGVSCAAIPSQGMITPMVGSSAF